MSDVFSLVPEGQAWTDYNAKPANKEDYDPKFFSGSLTAFQHGAGSGAVGLGQTVTSFGKQLISDPDVMNQFAPSYGAVKALFPDADQALNSSYDSAASALTTAQKGVKPEANSQGIAAQVLYGLGQFVPAIGATIAAGPAAGGAVAFGSTYEPTRQEFLEKGVDADTAGTLAAIQGTANAFGMALPAGVGGTLATRLLSGVGINTGFGMANRFAIGETLSDHGYKDLAQQYRAWDGQAMLVDGVLGLAFGGVHHWNASRADGEALATNQIDDQSIPTDGVAVTPETQPVTRSESGPANLSDPSLSTPDAIKPSDVDAAHVMNEGLYYDIEASPILHGTTESLNAHVAAMDEASRALMSGDPVNVSQQIRGLDGVTRPDAFSEAPEQHAAVRQVLDENGVDYSERPEPEAMTPDIRQDSAFLRAGNEAEQISTDPETGAVISSNSYDLLAARDMALANPDTKVLHPDTGKEMSLSEALADLDGQIATAQKESKVYSAAAACFLRNL